MINKVLSAKTIKQKTNEQAFMWMLHSKIFVEETDEDITHILSYWFKLAFNQEINEEDCNNNLIDKIRKKLLLNAGMKFPVLHDTALWIKIKESILFED